ncbi:high mobility group box domain-containing protein [Mucor mucedo]|uniref:high mobility group box domain-containing protein n=1 Tax=Mucor mucedo TaxID=29922 RepID=UPI00221FD80C|nr:high mobility group box domain-containing protein [Mucor mucedo]KAI7897133.1 high mobility group box domain-containing protein [Mucor mucedo]
MTDTRTRAAAIINQISKQLLSLTDILLESQQNKASVSSNVASNGTDHGEDADDKKKKKKKMEKDPNAPKRNLSSYMLYSQAVRPATVAQHPDLKAVDIAKLIGDKWNALTDKEKQPYVKQAEKEKARFDKELLSYKNKLAAETARDGTTTPIPSPATPPASSSTAAVATPKRKSDDTKKKSEDEPSKKKSKSSKKK